MEINIYEIQTMIKEFYKILTNPLLIEFPRNALSFNVFQSGLPFYSKNIYVYKINKKSIFNFRKLLLTVSLKLPII